MSYFLPRLERYRQLAEVVGQIWIFGIPDVDFPQSIEGITFVPLMEHDRLVKEWFLVIDSPIFFSALVANELTTFEVPNSERQFQGIWSFDDVLVSYLHTRLSNQLGIVPQIKYEKSIHDFERQMTFVGDIADKLVRRLERTNQKLVTSEKLRNNLTEMIVHDIRSPTTSLGLYIEMLLQDVERSQIPEFYRTSLRESLRAVNLISSISNDLLDIMFIEDNNLVLNQIQINPFTMLLSVYNLFQWVASQAGVQIELLVAEGMPGVLADQDKITRVLYNLVDNALQHVGSNDKITLDAQVREDDVEFIVQDTGRGIPAEFLPRIFDKYAKLETSGRHLGRGLGLTYCRLMVEAHGGAIEASSTVGEGTTFRFTLPRAN